MTFDGTELSNSYEDSFLGWVEQTYYGEQIWHQPVDHTNDAFTF